MRKNLYLLLLTGLWPACQSGVTSEFGTEPANSAYNDEAPRTKITYCTSAACDQIFNEERYLYNAAGQLTRIEYWNQSGSGKMEQNSYVEYLYNSNGQLTRKIRYGSPGVGWVAYDESEFDYADGVLKTERTYFNRRNPDAKVLTGTITYEFKDGKKVSQKWYDDFNKLYRRATFEYKNNVLTRETWYGEKENVIRVFEHLFAGNRRQISEYLSDSKNQISMVEKTYDVQGRLLTQETKVNNPLLCAMTAGVVRYSY
ncbi:MAG: hypothetical protein U0X91_25225 [Spirosomataceae bacterium]